MKTHLIAIVSILTIGTGLFAAPADRPLINELKDKDLRAKESVFADATRQKPIVLKSSKDGAKYFEKEALAKISKAVEFEKQIVLVFAWKGSGQDRLTFAQSEAHPKQIKFSYKPGRTRDLRPHVKIFVLQSDLKWSVK